MATRLTIYQARLRAEAREESLEGRSRIADEIAGDARSRAPVLTGAYRGGIGVEISGTQVHVIDSDDDALHKEYGTSDTPAHAALTGAAMARGRYSGMRPR